MAKIAWLGARFARLTLIALPALALSADRAAAKPSIRDMLKKGDRWTLTTEGETAPLHLRGGKSGKTNDGGWELYYAVTWGGRKGTLHGHADAKNLAHRVTLELTRKNGIRVTCTGYLSQETDRLMAGTCNEKVAPSAWYAVKGTQAAAKPGKDKEGYKEQYLACRKDERICVEKRKALAKEKGKTQNRYIAEINAHNKCRNRFNACQKKLGSGPSAKPYASFKNKISGKYDLPADQVGSKNFPQPKKNSALAQWMSAHNRALRTITHNLLRGSDRTGFDNLENQRCGKDVYCKAGLRQQAIACALGFAC